MTPDPSTLSDELECRSAFEAASCTCLGRFKDAIAKLSDGAKDDFIVPSMTIVDGLISAKKCQVLEIEDNEDDEEEPSLGSRDNGGHRLSSFGAQKEATSTVDSAAVTASLEVFAGAIVATFFIYY